MPTAAKHRRHIPAKQQSDQERQAPCAAVEHGIPTKADWSRTRLQMSSKADEMPRRRLATNNRHNVTAAMTPPATAQWRGERSFRIRGMDLLSGRAHVRAPSRAYSHAPAHGWWRLLLRRRVAVRDQVRDKLLCTACGSALTIEPSCSAKKCVAMSHTAKCVPRLTTEAIVFPKFGNDIP